MNPTITFGKCLYGGIPPVKRVSVAVNGHVIGELKTTDNLGLWMADEAIEDLLGQTLEGSSSLAETKQELRRSLIARYPFHVAPPAPSY